MSGPAATMACPSASGRNLKVSTNIAEFTTMIRERSHWMAGCRERNVGTRRRGPIRTSASPRNTRCRTQMICTTG